MEACAKTPKIMANGFSKKTIDFLIKAHKQTSPTWLDKHKAEHNDLVIQPVRDLALYLASRLERKPEARGYKFPRRGFGRLRRPKNWVTAGEPAYRDWLHIQASRPSNSIFDDNPGLYFYLSPESTFAGGGLYNASSRQIKQMRAWIDTDAKSLDKVLKSKSFKAEFTDGLKTDKILKTFPRLYPPDHKRIEWLRLQAYYVSRKISRKELYSNECNDIILANWQQTLRFNEILYEALSESNRTIAPEKAATEEPDETANESATDLWDDRL